MSEQTNRICHWCGSEVPLKAYCELCLATFASRPPAAEMTADEREAECRLLNWIEIPLDLIKDRMQELLRRPFWNHEIGANFAGLCREARWEGPSAALAEILELIPAEKCIVVSIPEPKA